MYAHTGEFVAVARLIYKMGVGLEKNPEPATEYQHLLIELEALYSQSRILTTLKITAGGIVHAPAILVAGHSQLSLWEINTAEPKIQCQYALVKCSGKRQIAEMPQCNAEGDS
jgi:hypothetical protein